MAKTKSKKPTINELKNAINNLIKEFAGLYKYISNIDSALASYVKFKNDEHKYSEWLKDQIEKQKKETQDDNSNTKDGGHARPH